MAEQNTIIQPSPEVPRISKQEQDKFIASLNIDKIIEDGKPKVEEAILQSLANERAAREPLPVPVEEAI